MKTYRHGFDRYRGPQAMRGVLFVLALALLLLTLAGCDSCQSPTGQQTDEQSGPIPALSGLAEDGSLQVSPEDRCPVCGMQVSKHVEFAAAMRLEDGRTYYFCATGCMILAFLHPDIRLESHANDIQQMVVQGYLSGEPLDAMKAIWVAGSDVTGPMGPALVPLRDEDALDAFMRRHGGEVFDFGKLDDELWESITGRKAVP